MNFSFATLRMARNSPLRTCVFCAGRPVPQAVIGNGANPATVPASLSDDLIAANDPDVDVRGTALTTLGARAAFEDYIEAGHRFDLSLDVWAGAQRSFPAPPKSSFVSQPLRCWSRCLRKVRATGMSLGR